MNKTVNFRMNASSYVRLAVFACTVVLLSACVSRAEIEALSENEWEAMNNQMAITSSAAEQAYVYCVSKAIIAELEPPYDTMEWEIRVFDNPMENAFAMAGGKIGVFNGLLVVTEDQDQLAAVIGHEVAHVTQDHSLERANQQMIAGTAVDLGAAALGGPTGDMVAMGAQLGLFLPYGRAQEAEADVVGLDYMAGAGFDPRASIKLWQNMEKAASGSRPPEFLSTHPSPDNRISKLVGQLSEALPIYNEAVAEGKGPRCKRPPPP